MSEVIIRNVPHKKLVLLFIVVKQLIPGKTWVDAFSNFICISLKNIFHKLLLIVDRDFKNLELYIFLVIQTLSNELKISYRLIPIEILIFIFYFENKFVYWIFHCYYYSVVLKDDTVDSPYNFIDSEFL